MGLHIVNDCDLAAMKCYFCKETEAHVHVCPKQPVECPFRRFGCRNQPIREDYDQHQVNYAVPTPLLCATRFEKVERTLTAHIETVSASRE